MMTRGLVLVAMALSLGGCESAGVFKRDVPLFDGQRFRASVKSERKDRQAFSVVVHQVSKSPRGAVQAGEYKAIQHCINFFGTSDIDWRVGPGTDPAAIPVVNDTFTLKGSCRDV